jgi:hypothetical protein
VSDPFKIGDFALLSAESPVVLPYFYRSGSGDNRAFVALQKNDLSIVSFEIVDTEHYELISGYDVRHDGNLPDAYRVGDMGLVAIADHSVRRIIVARADDADALVEGAGSVFANKPFSRYSLTSLGNRNLSSLFSAIHDKKLRVNDLWRDIEYRAAQKDQLYWTDADEKRVETAILNPHELIRQFKSSAEAIEWLMGLTKKEVHLAGRPDIPKEVEWSLVWTYLFGSGHNLEALFDLADQFYANTRVGEFIRAIDI